MLVDLEIVGDERDLQLLAAQAAAQRLERGPRALERLVRGLLLSRRQRTWPGGGWPGTRGSAGRAPGAARACSRTPRAPVRARPRGSGAAPGAAGRAWPCWAERVAEVVEGGQRTAAAPRPAVLVVEDQRPVEIDERQPRRVALARERRARLDQQRERAPALPCWPDGDGAESERPRRLVADAHPLEPRVGVLRHLGRLRAEVQLEVDLGEVHPAQRGLVVVAQRLRRSARLAQQLDGAAVLAAEEVQVRDVVVGERDQLRHALPLAERARLDVGVERARVIAEADEAQGHVAERAAPPSTS